MRAWPAILLLLLLPSPGYARTPVAHPPFYADGHSRPRALLFNPGDGLLYVALSTKDQVAVIDVGNAPARVLAYIKTGPFPQALAATPDGDVLVVCRYEAALGRIPKR